jgi:hypothetical protein
VMEPVCRDMSKAYAFKPIKGGRISRSHRRAFSLP